MNDIIVGIITKVSGSKITVSVEDPETVKKVEIFDFSVNYLSVGSLLGVKLIDGRILVVSIDEIYENNFEKSIIASITGTYDEVLEKYSFGTTSYPLLGEKVFALKNTMLKNIFASNKEQEETTIGTYIYDRSIPVSYNPNVLFGKHLGVFGNTGSGKTCTVVSIIQNYIRNHTNSDIKFIILDVNGEYRSAFNDDEYEYYEFSSLRFNHSILNNVEYGKLFRASEGTQYPALIECIADLKRSDNPWNMQELEKEINGWIDKKTLKDKYSNPDTYYKNSLSGYLRTMLLRIELITSDAELMNVINSEEGDTLNQIIDSTKKVHILDLQVSLDTLDIVLFLLFKSIYRYKVDNRKKDKNDSAHLNLVLEEAHRYINADMGETKLGNYYIDKLAREGRKYGIGLIFSSQVPSMLSYEIVSQCNSVIMHKITSKRDMEFLKGVLRVSNDSFFPQMSALEKQFAIVCGEAFSSDTIVRINDACPLPKSNDPVIREIQESDRGDKGDDNDIPF